MKPILFNTEMVQAILEGRKTQTRRVISGDIVNGFDLDCDGTIAAYVDQATGDSYDATAPAPYQPGDVLYVRETWCKYHKLKDDLVTPIEGTEQYFFRADGENPTPYNVFLVQREGYDEYDDYPKWRPSIHMPREAARIFLRVTDVRVERLRGITNSDAKKEGIAVETDNSGHMHLVAFTKLWNSIYAKRGFGWDTNPWVWVYSFERIATPEVEGKNVKD